MKNVVFAIWDNPEWYNTLIFSANSFNKKNYQVNLIYLSSNKKKIIKADFSSKIIIHPIKKKFFIMDFIYFFFFSLKIIYLNKPDFLILFNRRALICNIFLKFFFIKLKIIYHNFDFENPKNINNFIEFLETKIEFFFARFCNILVFPEINRGKIFLRLAKIKSIKIIDFYNCFPKNYTPKKTHIPYKIFKKPNIFLVSRLGSIGPNHYIEELIKSVNFWKKNIFLILAGVSISKEYLIKIQKLIKKFQLDKKVKVITSVNNQLWLKILFKSKLGICFYKTNSISHQNMAGASTKFNNYLYANIPFLTHKNKDFIIFRNNSKVFKIVDAKNPKDIARSVNLLKSNKKLYSNLQKKGHKLFKSTMNFEYQFEKFFNCIIKL